MADYTEEQLMEALRNADAAGDTDAATHIARRIQALRTTTQPQAPAGNRRRDGEPLDRYRLRLQQASLVNPHPQSPASRQMDANLADELTPSTNLFEQGMNGVNEGIAGIAGLPVDATTGALNLGVQGVNAVAGTDIPPISSPAGGSDVFAQALQQAGAISNNDPETTAQRYARSVGQEAGASAVPAFGAARKIMDAGEAAGPLIRRLLGLEAASATGAGAGAQTAREFMPESQLAELTAAVIGGGAPIATARAMTPRPAAPSIDELRDRQGAAYGRVEQSHARLSPQTSARVRELIQGRVAAEGVPEFLPQPVRSVASRADALPDDALVTDVEDLRRIIGNDVAGNADPQTRRIGVDLKDQIDEYLGTLQAGDLQAGDPQQVMADLSEGRAMTQRIARSDTLTGETGAVTRAERRAESTGTGGNEVNAIRQNIRRILDSPRQRRQFSEEQLEAMNDIVSGTATTNTLRMIGRLSPTSGALPMMANMGAVGAAGATSNPLLAVPMVAGMIAKGGAEALTQKQVRELDELVRNGAPLDPSRMTTAQAAALTGLMAAQARERD